MKACVLLTVLWFAFSAVKATTNITTTLPTSPTSTTTPPEPSTSTSTTTSLSTTTNTATPTPSSNTPESTTATTTATTTSITTTLPTSPTSTTTPPEPSTSTTTSLSTTTNTATPTTSYTSTTSKSTTATITATTTSITTTLPTSPTSTTTPPEPSTSTTTSLSTTTNTATPTPSSNTPESTTATTTTEIATSTTTALPITPTSTIITPEASTSNTSSPSIITSTPTAIPSNTSTNPESTTDNTNTNTTTTETTPTSNITIPETSASTTTPSTTMNTSTPTPSNTSTSTESTTASLPCEQNQCIYGAKCINLVDQYVCQCPLGLYYTNTLGCLQGKIFPGDLSLDETYNPSLENVTSEEYKQLHSRVIKICEAAFENQTDYKQTVILSVKPSPSTRKRLRAGERMTFAVVSLINMFNKSTSLSKSDVQGLIQKALEEDGLSNSSFATVLQCNLPICDKRTTKCIEKNDYIIADCECNPGLDKMNPQDNSCLLCADCHQENNRHCIIKEETPHCQCMTNFHEKDGRCQECDFGYSGEDCKDNYLVVIIAVAVTCGIVIVVLTGVLIYKSLSAKKESKPEKRRLLMNDYSSTREDSESIPGTNVAPRTKLFPQVRTRSSAGQEALARNANEGGLANTAYFPEQDYDDIELRHSSYEMSPRRKF